jgi:hypothetical protein
MNVVLAKRMKQSADIKTKSYHFHINGERGVYEVAFGIDEDNIESACDCNYNADKRMCWHRQYVLAGKTQRLGEGENNKQEELIDLLSKTSGGREQLRQAKATFGEKETCRRCNSREVVDLKNTVSGKFLKIFVPTGRRYFCWSCRWSW